MFPDSVACAHDIFDLLAVAAPPVAAPEVCPDANPESISAWARRLLGFQPSAKQAEILDAPDRFLILCASRQWGKSTTIAIKALHHAVHRGNQSVVVISRTRFQAGLLIHKIVRFALSLGFKIRRAFGERHSLLLPNGSYVLAVPHNADTTAGNTADVLVVDEAALVSDEVFASATPILGRTRGAIWLLSTPRRQVGFFYNLWHTADRVWRRVLSTVADCPDIDPAFLRLQEELDPVRFRRDFHCEFIAPAGAFIAREEIDALVDPNCTAWAPAPAKGDSL